MNRGVNMNKKWEVRRVSAPERIFDKIKEEMAQPVGIIIFGADCKLKDEVVNKTISSLPGIATSTNAAPTPTLVKYIQEHSMIYAKVEKEPIRPLMSSLEKVEFNKRVFAIEQSNPTADGLDYFIVVEEEKEG